MGETFYLNAFTYGNNILYTGITKGKRVRGKIPYKPKLYLPCKEETKYKTIYGENLKQFPFDSIRDAREFVNQYKDIENFKVYGNTYYEYCLISERFPNDVDWDLSKIRIGIFDIEVNSDPETGGFSSTENPFQPIISIAFKLLGEDRVHLFGCGDYSPPDNIVFKKCSSEEELLKSFIDFWSENYVDIISGWNCAGFDIPYIIKRCEKVLGQTYVKKLSPWGIIKERIQKKFNQKFNRYEEHVVYTICGIATLDYFELYKKYRPGGATKASHKLDSVAEDEVGENKIQYEGSLHKLYTENKQKFFDYNIKDVILVEKIDNKCKLLELALTLAYDSKCNFEDVFQQTRMWDSLIFNFLKKKNIQIPQKVHREKVEYEGAFVNVPITGFHKWIITIDGTSLYPSICMGKNISPETIIEPEAYTDSMKQILAQPISVNSILNQELDLTLLKQENVTLTPNKQLFRRDIKGFIPEILEKMFKSRQTYSNKLLVAKGEYEKLKLEIKTNSDLTLTEKLKQLEMDISRYDNLQNSKKLCLNSCYGVLAEKGFRFFDVRLAEAITLEGQLSNRWVATNMNSYLNTLLSTNDEYIIYGDTDSIMISLETLVDKICPKDYKNEKIVEFLSKTTTKKLQPAVNSFCNNLSNYVNSYSNSINYKLEKICSSGIFIAKKRYALNVYSNKGVVYAEPKVKVTGLEIVKTSTPKKVRNALETCVKIILNESERNLQTYVKQFKSEFKQLPIEEISFPRSVKGIDKYFDVVKKFKSGTPIHVRGSILYNDLLVKRKIDKEVEFIKDGDKIKFCYLKLPNPLKENVISFHDTVPKKLAINEYIDYNMMFNKTFEEPLKTILEKMKWSLEETNVLTSLF